jgi:hypothetical protein
VLGVALAVVNQTDRRLVRIQPDHIDIGARELDRQRQPHVTETDYSYFHCPLVREGRSFWVACPQATVPTDKRRPRRRYKQSPRQ